MRTIRNLTGITALVALTIIPLLPAMAQQTHKKPPAAHPPVNATKGQGQLVGANGEFGTIYTLDNGVNFEILSARYTMEPFNAYTPVYANTESKLLLLDIAVKNANAQDFFFNTDSWFTLVDEKGELYNGFSLALHSKGGNDASWNLRPGQGLGQPALHDPLQVAFPIPNKARIVKIMLNLGRKGRNEKVVRYYVAGATKAEAGEAGDPKNVIAPLPPEIADPADKSGAVTLDMGKGVIGTFYPSGPYGVRMDSVTYSTDPIFEKNPPEDGQKYVVVTITGKNLTDKKQSFFDLGGGDVPSWGVIDGDGEKAKWVGLRMAKRDESPDTEFEPGGTYTFRAIFTIPKDGTAKTIILGAGNSHKWAIDAPK